MSERMSRLLTAHQQK